MPFHGTSISRSFSARVARFLLCMRFQRLTRSCLSGMSLCHVVFDPSARDQLPHLTSYLGVPSRRISSPTIPSIGHSPSSFPPEASLHDSSGVGERSHIGQYVVVVTVSQWSGHVYPPGLASLPRRATKSLPLAALVPCSCSNVRQRLQTAK